MVDVVLSADNLTVLGGPQELDVDLNIGADGKRGGIFFTGLANPVGLNINQDFPSIPQTFDFYIDVNPTSQNYLQVYQYLFQDGVLSWYPSFKLNSQNFFTNEVVTFTTGEALVNINVTDLGIGALPFDDVSNSFASFNVQATISNINSELAPDGVGLDHFPAALSISVGDAFFDGTGLTDPAEFPLRLPISLQAIQYDGTSWIPIDNKDVIVYFNIGYANPNSIITNLSGGDS
jgi:hypothetical protein